jgi:hypothetical protein
MTDSTRGVRFRRGSRRPGWALFSALLVLAIVASSALVFTDRVELLKLAVILALWAAVVAAFVSFIYRRQADIDGARARDLKLVYDLQLDREISARREYELSIESQLRRELTSELRAQASDEMAGLRAELAALRANLQMLFDTELQDRPAIETDRSSVRALREWPGAPEGTDRVISSRIDADADAADAYAFDDPKTEESPIIDVPAEPDLSTYEQRMDTSGGAHRMASDADRSRHRWQQQEPAPIPSPEPVPPPIPMVSEPVSQPAPPPAPQPVWEPRVEPPSAPTVVFPRLPAEPAAEAAPEEPREAPSPVPDEPPEWRMPPAGDFSPSAISEPTGGNGALSSVSSSSQESPFGYPQRRFGVPEPTMTTAPAADPPRGRHSTSESATKEPERRGRHSSQADAYELIHRTPPPTLAAPAPPVPSPAPPLSPMPPATPDQPRSARHRDGEDPQEPAGQHEGGQPLSELLTRLQASSGSGGRRRRREE